MDTRGPRPLAADHERVTESEERFRLLVESVRDYAIFMLDPEGYVTTWNAGAQRIKGYSAPEILGQHFSRFYTADAIARKWPAHELEAAAAEGRFEDEGWRVRKDGSRFWANVVITALRDREGRLRGFAKVTRDITERRHNEEHIRRLNAELERQVAELARTNRELGLKSHENDAFVYSVSHDLRQPLVNLQGFGRELALTSQDLRRLLEAPETPPELVAKLLPQLDAMSESLRYIESSVLHLGQIINGLLRLSRAGRVEYAQVRVEVAPLVARVLDALHSSIVARRARVRVGALPAVEGDPSAIEQVFANLIGNAINYLDPQRPGRIELEHHREGEPPGMVRFEVRDNGIGIPDAARSRIFQVFQRLRPELAPGEGIGLAIVQRIVERHGGRVGFVSEPGRGTSFSITLPAARG